MLQAVARICHSADRDDAVTSTRRIERAIEQHPVSKELCGCKFLRTGGVACDNVANEEKRICVLPQLYVCDGMQQCKGYVDEDEQACQFQTP